jgi:hypothetical protein
MKEEIHVRVTCFVQDDQYLASQRSVGDGRVSNDLLL